MKRLLFLGMAIVLFVGQLLAQNNDTPQATAGYFYKGYCSPDNKYVRYGYPKHADYNDIVSTVLARYKAKDMASDKGATVVGLRICFGSDCSRITALLRNELGGNNVLSTTVSVKKGWNEIYFDKSYEITGDKDIVFGYSYAQRDAAKGEDPFVIACDKPDPSNQPEDAYYASSGSSFARRVYDAGILKVELILKGNLPQYINQFEISRLKTSLLKDAKGNISARMDFRNLGKNTIENIELFFFGDQLKIASQKIDLQLNPLEVKRLKCADIPVGNNKKLIVKVNRINGTRVSGKMLTTDLSEVLDHAYDRQVLIETFSTETCSGCPAADKAIEKTIESDSYKGKFIYMVHHTGYEDDKFTLPESKKLLWLYGTAFDDYASVYAPAFSLDRRKSEVDNLSDYDKYPAHSTHNGTPTFYEFFDEALEYPAMIKLEVSEKFDKKSRNLDIDITGETLDRLYGKDVRMNIYLVEDRIYSYDQNGAGKDTSSPTGKKLYKNMGLLRKFLTPYDGESYKIPADGKISFKKSVTLDESWNSSNIRIIAFVSKPLIDIDNCDVYNAAQTTIKEVESVGFVSDSKMFVSVLDGTIIANEGFDVMHVYTMDGRLVANRNLPAGVYIVQVSSGEGIMTTKVVVR